MKEFCGDSGIYVIDTYMGNRVTCNKGDLTFFSSFIDDNKNVVDN